MPKKFISSHATCFSRNSNESVRVITTIKISATAMYTLIIIAKLLFPTKHVKIENGQRKNIIPHNINSLQR